MTGQIVAVAAVALLIAQAINFTLLIAGNTREARQQAAGMSMGWVAAVTGALNDGRMNEAEIELRQRRRALRRAGILGDGSARRFARRAVRRGGEIQSPVILAISDKPVELDGFFIDETLTQRARSLYEGNDPWLAKARIRRGPQSALPDMLTPAPPPDQNSPVGKAIEKKNEFDGGGTLAPTGEAILVDFTLPSGRTLSFATEVRKRATGYLGWQLVQTLVLYLAVLLPLGFIAWRISRPLRDLTVGARKFATNGTFEPVAANGPDDLQRLILAFNNMQYQVSGLIGEKDVMLGAIGHDLKTPLASLRLRLETLSLESDEESERDRMIATIEEMVAMLDDILTLARLGRSGEAVEQVSLPALVDSIADDYPAENVRLRIAEVPDGSAPMRPVLVRRALRNLIDNAMAYGGNAELSVTRDGGEVRFIVDDKGPGIPADQIEELFEPFHRADASRNRKSGGSGLGLTIARAIARAHGGDIVLRNREEGGLRATFSLPA